MDLIRDMRPFGEGFHQMSVVATDLAEAEALIKTLAEAEQQRNPQNFAGKAPCVYCKLPYVPPCDPFKELRRLILRIRENTGLRANYRGVVAIDVSEWIGHEREEYFTVLLKYLYDHRNLWKIAAVLNQCNSNQIHRFLTGCSRYITPRLFPVRVFEDRDTLCRVIRDRFLRQNKPIGKEAADLLADALSRQTFADVRSMPLIDRAVEETLAVNGAGRVVTVSMIQECLADPCSALNLMAGMPLFDERSIAHEDNTLQL